MKFTYKALKDNKNVSGKIEALNVDGAVELLKDGGFFPIEVKEASTGASGLNAFFERVNYKDIVNFTRQLAIMLNAGVTLIDALDIFKKQSDKESFTKMITAMDREIRGGKAFSEVLSNYPQHFSRLYISLVKAGEASGKLAEILLDLAKNLEHNRELRGKITGALIYPSLIVIGMFVVIFILITFVIPKLLSLYSDLNVKLPWSTQIIVDLSDFSSAYWPFIIVAAGGGLFALFRFYKSIQGKALADYYLLRIPVLKTLLIQSMLVDTTRAISILVGSGVSILEALTIIREGNSNGEIREAFRRVQQKVEKGITLGSAFREEPIFPPLIVQMANVGEQTGHLDETMGKISEYYNIETELAIKNFTALIEPTVLVILGVVIGFVIFSVITPIYSLTSSIQ